MVSIVFWLIFGPAVIAGCILAGGAILALIYGLFGLMAYVTIKIAPYAAAAIICFLVLHQYHLI